MTILHVLTNDDDNVSFGNTDDTVFGLNGNDTLYTAGGKDVVYGGEGDDVASLGAGRDVFDGGEGKDRVFYALASSGVVVSLADGYGYQTGLGEAADKDTFTRVEDVIGSLFDDEITGDGGANWLVGADGFDTIIGGAGIDSIHGGNDDDLLEGGSGADLLAGGEGIDTAEYRHASSAIQVSLAAGSGALGEAKNDFLTDIENVLGSEFNDLIAGNDGANRLYGYGGNDTLDGREESDYLDGADGNDQLYGGAGSDDLLGGKGADLIVGGDGVDLARYLDSAEGVKIDLALRTASGGDAEGDVLVSIESVKGSNFGDELKGNNDSNVLSGRLGDDLISGRGGADVLSGGDDMSFFDNDNGGGKDTINGGGGADEIFGGLEKDRLTGGTGSDTFHFTDLKDSFVAASGRDVITDFIAGEDHLDLHLLHKFGNGHDLDYVGNAAFSGQEGEVRYATSGANTIVQIDFDGDQVEDFAIQLNGHKTLTDGDFIL